MTAKYRFAFATMPRVSFTALLLLGLLSLSACAVKQPLAIQSRGQAVSAPAAISFVEIHKANAMQTAIGKAMMRRSLTVAPEAPLLAEVVVTERPAKLGLARDTAEIAWNSEPRKRRWLDKCEAKKLRSTLVITDRSTGTIRYRGTGEMTDCEFDTADYERLADQLVADVLSEGGTRL